MFGKKEIILLCGLSCFLLAQAANIDDPFLKDFIEKKIEDGLFSAKVRDGSREELEEDKGPSDASASQEDSKEISSKSADESDEDDDDDDFGLSALGINDVFRNFPNIFGFTQPRSWWSGPNVCIDRDEKEEKDESGESEGMFMTFGVAHFSSCHNTPDKYSCKTITKKSGITKTVTVTYRCCHGFIRNSDKPGCNKVEIKPISEIADEAGAGKFLDMVKSAGMEKVLDGNVTIFLPSDAAMSSHQANFMDSLNQVDPLQTNEVPTGSQSGLKGESALVMAHLVDSVVQSSDLYDEMVLKTKDNSSLRINIYASNLVTVNCARLNTTDKLTENGVVHLVNTVLMPVTQNLAQKLSQPRFSKFKQLLEEHDLWDLMEGTDPLTVFALDNDNVEKLDQKYKLCVKNILRHHIVRYTLCSTVPGKISLLASDLSPLLIERQDDELIVGNSSKILKADVMVTNGVVHEVDSFIFPPSARCISELLEKSNDTAWKKILEDSGMLEEVEATPNITMFIPTNTAIESWLSLGGQKSRAELRDIVKFHIGTKQNGQIIETQLSGKNLTISTMRSMMAFGLPDYSLRTTVQCAALVRTGGRVCNGVLHEVSSVLQPPSQSILEYIQGNPDLTSLKQMLDGTELEKEMKTGLSGLSTFLAPSNSAFSTLPEETLKTLMDDKNNADQILRSHIVNGVVCCSNVGQTRWPFISTVSTLRGRALEVNRLSDGRVNFGASEVNKCDVTLTDGILHLVDTVFVPRKNTNRVTELIMKSPKSDIILAGI